MSWLISTALALLTGTASALLPVVNAELYAVAAAGRSSPVVVVLALATGQTFGKLLLFQTARHGTGRLTKWAANHTPTRAARWTNRITQSLASPRTGIPLVLLSATLGLPPLAAVSLAAGASTQPRWHFTLLCLTGRTTRFAAIILPATWGFSLFWPGPQTCPSGAHCTPPAGPKEQRTFIIGRVRRGLLIPYAEGDPPTRAPTSPAPHPQLRTLLRRALAASRRGLEIRLPQKQTLARAAVWRRQTTFSESKLRESKRQCPWR